MNFQDDDNEDLSKLDRGDNMGDETPPQPEAETEAEAADATDGGQPRDEKGRFAKTEDADEDTAESDDEDDEADEATAERDDDLLPNGKIRLRKALDQRNHYREEAERLRAELESLRQKDTPRDEQPDKLAVLNGELDALYEAVEEARAEGDTQTAAKVQRQIDAKNREIARAEEETVMSAATRQQREAEAFNTRLDAAEREYPAIDRNSEEYDPEAVKLVDFYIQAHEKMGLPPSAALDRALVVVFGGRKESKPVEKAPETPKKGVKRALETQKRQPPDMSNAGVDSNAPKIDVSKMTDEEWDALPASTRAKLRGDFE